MSIKSSCSISERLSASTSSRNRFLSVTLSDLPRGLQNGRGRSIWRSVNRRVRMSEVRISDVLLYSECHTLSFYVKNASQYFTSNTVIIFSPGQHQLNLPSNGQSVVNVTGISNFAMIGKGAVMSNQSEEGAPRPNSTIICISKSENKPRNGILFYKADAIHIENLTIENCGAMFTVRGPDYFTLVSALTFRESYNISLKQVRIDKSLGFGLDADRIFGSFTVSISAFLWCRAYPLQYNKNIGGNARFWYTKYNQTAQNTTLIIDHSWFMYGRLINENRYRGFYYASGLIIFIFIPSVNVHINNSTVKSNIGSHGGNVAI